jgi:hypothetical protein
LSKQVKIDKICNKFQSKGEREEREEKRMRDENICSEKKGKWKSNSRRSNARFLERCACGFYVDLSFGFALFLSMKSTLLLVINL